MAPERDYRLYVIGKDGHIVGRTDIKCADDEEAKTRAKQFVKGRPIELWQGVRKIGLFEPQEY